MTRVRLCMGALVTVAALALLGGLGAFAWLLARGGLALIATASSWPLAGILAGYLGAVLLLAMAAAFIVYVAALLWRMPRFIREASQEMEHRWNSL